MSSRRQNAVDALQQLQVRMEMRQKRKRVLAEGCGQRSSSSF